MYYLVALNFKFYLIIQYFSIYNDIWEFTYLYIYLIFLIKWH